MDVPTPTDLVYGVRTSAILTAPPPLLLPFPYPAAQGDHLTSQPSAFRLPCAISSCLPSHCYCSVHLLPTTVLRFSPQGTMIGVLFLFALVQTDSFSIFLPIPLAFMTASGFLLLLPLLPVSSCFYHCFRFPLAFYHCFRHAEFSTFLCHLPYCEHHF